MDTARSLTENLAALLRREHHALAEFLVALADFDRHRVWATLGYPSLFSFLVRELRLSKGAAHYRKVAAELIQEVPAVVEPLRRGDLCLTSIIEAAKVVTPENCEQLLPRLYGLSKREAMEVVAALQPHPTPPVRTVVTSLRPSASHSTLPSALDLGSASPPSEPTVTSTDAAGWPDEPAPPPTQAAPSVARPQVVPLSEDLGRLHITVSKRFTRKLAAARDARPGQTDEALLEAALDLLLAQTAKRRGLVDKPRQKPRPSRRDHIPAHVKREVWARDGGRCAYRLASGEVCGSTHGLEFDHVKPLACGGTSDAANVRVACRPHNLEAARLVFGDAVMDGYVGKGARRRRVASLTRGSCPGTPRPRRPARMASA